MSALQMLYKQIALYSVKPTTGLFKKKSTFRVCNGTKIQIVLKRGLQIFLQCKFQKWIYVMSAQNTRKLNSVAQQYDSVQHLYGVIKAEK